MRTHPVAMSHHGQDSEGLNMTITEPLDTKNQESPDMWNSGDSMMSSKDNMMS
jgi:hypothetical protein